MELLLAAPPTTCVAHSILPYVPHEGLCDVTLPVLPDHLAGPVPSLPTLAMLRGCVNTLNVLPPALSPLHKLVTIRRKPFPVGAQRVRIKLNKRQWLTVTFPGPPHP